MGTLDLVQLTLGAVNLALILKIILNDLHEIRQMLFRHLEDHAKK